MGDCSFSWDHANGARTVDNKRIEKKHFDINKKVVLFIVSSSILAVRQPDKKLLSRKNLASTYDGLGNHALLVLPQFKVPLL